MYAGFIGGRIILNFLEISDLAASGKNYLSPHVKIPFTAVYYHVDMDTPYVGTLEIDKKGFQVPQKGVVQVYFSSVLLTR